MKLRPWQQEQLDELRALGNFSKPLRSMFVNGLGKSDHQHCECGDKRCILWKANERNFNRKTEAQS